MTSPRRTVTDMSTRSRPTRSGAVRAQQQAVGPAERPDEAAVLDELGHHEAVLGARHHLHRHLDLALQALEHAHDRVG